MIEYLKRLKRLNDMKNKIWALLVYLSENQWLDRVNYGRKKPIRFDEDFWQYILSESVKCGINTIILDVGDGIQYDRFPEISAPGAWSKIKVLEKVEECRSLGIELVPKLNFATPHDHWLGEYSRMVSTETYYRVCKAVIKEAYEAFDMPKYFHIGMDEEDAKHVKANQLAIFRQGDLYWHDLRFLIDTVKELGTTPWMWSCPLFTEPEEYAKHISPDEVILSPWYYNAFRKEHWTPVDSRMEYAVYYNEGEYKSLNMKWVEEDPFLARFREVAVPLSKKGYKYVPCASVFNRCVHNHHDLIEYIKENVDDENIVGFMSTPWMPTVPDAECQIFKGESFTSKTFYEETFKFFKEAKDKFYPEEA